MCIHKTFLFARALFVGIAFATFPLSQALAYDEDDGTQMNFKGVGNVHICANSRPMLGLDAKHNRFLCSTTVAVTDQSSWTADTSTHQTFTFNGAQVSIHTCPSGQAMMGLSIDKNVLICAQGSLKVGKTGGFATTVDGGGNETKIEELSFKESVHGCSSNDGPPVMAGVKVDENLLVCINYEQFIP
jgi:hypothetical protein